MKYCLIKIIRNYGSNSKCKKEWNGEKEWHREKARDSWKNPVVTPENKKPIAPAKNNGSDVTEELAKKAIGQEPVVSIEDRILQVEKLKGLTDRHKRSTATLNSLSEFKYNSSESCKITIVDDSGKSFTTGDINLIKNIADGAEAYIIKRLKAAWDQDYLIKVLNVKT